MDLFKEIIPSIMHTKKSLITNIKEEKFYNPYIVNKALSYHTDCVFYANTMNMNFHLEKKLQYDYLLNSVRSKKRPFKSWHKQAKNDDLESVKRYYNYSTQKAKEAMRILTEEQIAIIKSKTKIGD